MTAGKSPCPIIGCEVHRGAGRLLCMPHWRRVSRKTQREVWSTWDAYQHAKGRAERQEALIRYRAAANKAIEEAGGK
jgi:hypothetical protein